MNEIELSKEKDDIINKSIENTNNAIKLLNSFVIKNELLTIENLKNQSYIVFLKMNIENLKKELKENYKDDKIVISKLDSLSSAPEMKKAEESVKDMRLAIGLMKIIAANITGYDGDPTMWYRYTEAIDRLDNSSRHLP